jgi:hypothetical protein
MKTELTGQMDSDMIEEMTKAAERFRGREVRIVIEENNGQERKPRGRRE